MKYYLYIENNEIFSSGYQPMGESFISKEVSKELHDDYVAHRNKYKYVDGEIVLNENYEQEEEEKYKQEQRQILIEQIEELDKKRIRAVCEPSVKDEITGETWLDYYNKQIASLREELNGYI